MKHKLIVIAVLSAVSTSAFAGNESWALSNGSSGRIPSNAIYDPAQGPLPMERRFLMTREGAEEARYNAQNPAPAAVISQPAAVAQAAPVQERRSYALPTAPARTVPNAPEWFVRLPDDTADMVFAAGTATSTDEQMAYDKARMAAERKLIEQMGAKISSLTKSYRNDTGSALQERFEQVVRKQAAGELIGAQRVDSQVTHDGQAYKVYILLRLPLGANNTLRTEKTNAQGQREVELRANRAQQELDRTQAEDRRQQDAERARQREEIGPSPAAPAPAAAPAAAPAGNVELIDTDNAEYRRRRAEALQRPGAAVGRITLQ
jgi:hypothetical protein